MPRYEVQTDQGRFEVELDRESSDEADLHSLVTQHLGEVAAGHAAPIPPPNTRQSAFSAVGRTAADIVKKAAIPTALGVGGFIGGGAVAGPPGAIAGESALSALGEYLNQTLGITERSKAQIGVAAAGGPITRGIMRGGRELVRAVAPRLPGASALLHEQADDTMKGVAAALSPGKPEVDRLYAEVARHNPPIRTTNILKTIREIRSSEGAILSDAIQNRKLLNILDDFERQVTARGGVFPFQNVHATLKRIGEFVGSTEARGGTAHGQFSQIYKAFNQDLESTARTGGPTAIKALKDATSAARRQFAADDFGEILGKATTDLRQGDALSFIRGGKALRALENSKEFEQAVRLGDIKPAEVKEIKDLLLKMAKLPVLPPPVGANAGSRSSLAAGGVGMAVGNAIGGPGGAVIGSGIGLAAPVLIAKAVMSPLGRKVLNAAIASGKPITTPTLGILANVLRSGTVVREPQHMQEQRTLPAAAGPFLNQP